MSKNNKQKAIGKIISHALIANDNFCRVSLYPVKKLLPLGTELYLKPDNNFKFDLGDFVQIEVSGEEGKVIGRAEYSETNSYQIRYMNANEEAVEKWWDESALSSPSAFEYPKSWADFHIHKGNCTGELHFLPINEEAENFIKSRLGIASHVSKSKFVKAYKKICRPHPSWQDVIEMSRLLVAEINEPSLTDEEKEEVKNLIDTLYKVHK